MSDVLAHDVRPTTDTAPAVSDARLDAAFGEGLVHGREAQVAAALAALGAARTGAPWIVVVGGEAGIGKTRLLAEVAVRARRTGARVLYGRAEQDPVVSYQPFAEALGEESLARLAPADAGAARPDEDPGDARLRLFGAVRERLTRESAPAPLLLALDDVHWADEPTLQLLRHVVTAPEAPAALVLLTHRPDEVEHPEALARVLVESERRRRLTRIDLAGLDAGALAALVAERTDGPSGGSESPLVCRLQAETGGNPFFVLELLRTGDAAPDGGDRPPTGVREVIRRRVERLGPLAAEVLRAAAVVGHGVEPELTAAVADLPVAAVTEALDLAARAGLVRPRPAGSRDHPFAHALVERSLRDDVGPAARGRLHDRAARALDALCAGRPDERIVERARHWHLAEPGDPTRSLDCAARAGRRLLEQREPLAAARWLARALVLEHDRARRCDLLVDSGRAELGCGDAAFRATLLEAARLAHRMQDGPRLVRAALANNRGFVSSGGEADHERIAVLGFALEAVGDEDSGEHAALLATLADELYYTDERERRIALSDRALAMARRVGDQRTLGWVLLGRIAIWEPETTERVLRDSQENVGIADALGDPLDQFRALRWRGALELELGHVQRAEATVARLERLADDLGDPTARWMLVQDQGNLAILHGRFDDAERLVQEAFELGTDTGQPDALRFYANAMAALRWEQGRLGELQPLIAQATAEATAVPAYRAALALAYLDAGLSADARAVLDAELATGFDELPRDVMWLFGHVGFAHVAADTGAREAAQVLAERLAPYTGRIPWNGSVWGGVDLALGRLALARDRLEEAAGHLTDARDSARAWGARVHLARAQVELGRLALEQGRPDEAAERLDEAAQAAGRAGALGVERRARALLGRAQAGMAFGASVSGRRLAFRTQGRTADEPQADSEPEVRDAITLDLAGDVWALEGGGRSLRLEDAKGMRYLARLLAGPGVEQHVLVLQGEGAPKTSEGDAGPVLDASARHAYRERLVALEEEIDQAERFHDPERRARAQAEREAVGRELAAAVGLRGHDRRLGDRAERARVNVRRALDRTIARIEAADPALGHHLRATVRTGAFCVYDPPPTDATRWRVQGTP